MSAGALVVSLHDVSPQTHPECVRILAELSGLGVPTCSLLVVPDHHRGGHFLADPAWCDWLSRHSRTGHEIVAHGYHHERARREGETIVQRWMTRVYTAGEGEFYDLDYDDAASLLRQAREDFAQLGLTPRGFIAPAWLLSAPAEKALRELNWEYTTRLSSVSDLRSDHVFRSQSLVWSVRAAWRRGCSVLWNGLLFRALKLNPLLRISIHPGDILHKTVWDQIRSLTEQALEERDPLTYHAWLERQRASSS